jgi:deoxycytidine triphosphate deaminase
LTEPSQDDDPCDPKIDATTYWKRPKDDLGQDYWIDPFAKRPGLLAADRIRRYALDLKMIDPFCEKNLKPASYSLTLGPLVQVEGADDLLTVERPTLKIPPNAMAFVSMREAIRLPHYIAARFNLSIELIYRGLLLGTGPQVDPGFQGVLSCPLHNLSNNYITIELGQHLATIDFETTTGLPTAVAKRSFKSDHDLYGAELELKQKHQVWLFDNDKRWLRPIIGYPPGKNVIQSSVGMAVAEVGRMRQQLRFGAFTAIIAGLAVGAALMGVIVALAIGYWQVANDNTAIRKQLQDTSQGQAQTAEQRQAQLRACFAAIDSALSAKDSPGLRQLPPECKNLT